jgi:hypothetical protein
MSRLHQSGTDTVGLTSITSGLVPTVIDSLIRRVFGGQSSAKEGCL